MKKKRFSVEQIAGALKQVEVLVAVRRQNSDLLLSQLLTSFAKRRPNQNAKISNSGI
jgi:hypothetical protein